MPSVTREKIEAAVLYGYRTADDIADELRVKRGDGMLLSLLGAMRVSGRLIARECGGHVSYHHPSELIG